MPVVQFINARATQPELIDARVVSLADFLFAHPGFIPELAGIFHMYFHTDEFFGKRKKPDAVQNYKSMRRILDQSDQDFLDLVTGLYKVRSHKVLRTLKGAVLERLVYLIVSQKHQAGTVLLGADCFIEIDSRRSAKTLDVTAWSSLVSLGEFHECKTNLDLCFQPNRVTDTMEKLDFMQGLVTRSLPGSIAAVVSLRSTGAMQILLQKWPNLLAVGDDGLAAGHLGKLFW